VCHQHHEDANQQCAQHKTGYSQAERDLWSQQLGFMGPPCVAMPSCAFVFIAPPLQCLRPTSYFTYRRRSSCDQLPEVSEFGRSQLLTSGTSAQL
jgi:hypothetical protein